MHQTSVHPRMSFGENRFFQANKNKSKSLSLSDNDDDDDYDEDLLPDIRSRFFRQQAMAADHLSMRLLQVDTEEEEEEILRESLNLSRTSTASDGTPNSITTSIKQKKEFETKAQTSFFALLAIAFVAFILVTALLLLGIQFVGPPNQPVGPYRLLERQEGDEFFDFYNFYEGRDSVGSNGFNTYVSEERALELEIVNVTMEEDILDAMIANITESRHRTNTSTTNHDDDDDFVQENQTITPMKPFVYMSSASSSKDNPRESIRLEGKRRFNRGLFVIDLRHMPAGCGVWPAFWLTDEANWPVNGEIDIVEGVNFQSVAKTALHSTNGCTMDDVPVGVMTGKWDTAIGIPDRKTGIPDMTIRHATDCFVYNPKQWLNQGCVAVDNGVGTLGVPLNKKGGGVYVLEWDPINRHMRSWVFTPHGKVPKNLMQAIATASQPNEEDRVSPDPDLWPLPYGYFAIGDETSCQAKHFKNMRLVFNLAFCGSVAGNRYQLDCPIQAKKYKTCNDWVGAEPEELMEAYWKVRGVYVYEREWQRAWL